MGRMSKLGSREPTALAGRNAMFPQRMLVRFFFWSPSTVFAVSPLPAGCWSCRFQIQSQVGQGRVRQRIERESGGRWFGATRVWLLGRVRAGATREAAVADESMGRFLGSGSPSLLHTMSFSSDFEFVFSRRSMPCAGARVLRVQVENGKWLWVVVM